MSKTKVLIADTRRLFSEALGDALSRNPDLTIIDYFPTHGREVLNVVNNEAPDIVLLDFWIGEMQGATVARLIKKTAPNCTVILLSWFLSPSAQIPQQSVSAILSKGASLAEVAELIGKLNSRQTSREQAEDVAEPELQGPETTGVDALERLIGLSPREMDVLSMLAFRPKDIAQTLKISEKTVRNHINNILGKTGARSSVEAVAIARRCRGLPIH